jgi:PAS domain S-box-containing protein
LPADPAHPSRIPAQALLAAIVEGSDDAIVSKTLDGTILSWNPAAQRLLGYSAQEAIGKSVTMLFPPGPDEEPAILERIRRGERVTHYHTKRRRKDGELLDVVLTISPVRDAEGRIVAASKILRLAGEQESLFRAATENALDAIVAADEAGRITYLNPAAQRMFGYLAVEAVGQPLTILMPERLQESHRNGFARFQRTGEPHILGRTVEVVARSRDGREIPVEVSLSTWTAQQGRSFVGILRDVSERKRAEEARLLAQRREAEVARLEEMNRFKTLFINTAAHEMLNPLTPMRSILHVMRRAPHALPPERLARNLDILARNLDRLNRLVGDLLDASRLEARKMGLRRRAVDLGVLVGEAAESFQAVAAAKGIHLACERAAGVQVEADPDRVGQVLANLLSNAIKFTPAGGRVDLLLRAVAGGAEVAVRDTGIGFDRAAAAKLFQPFSRAHLAEDQVEPGTGLGLYVSKGIVELHGGRIACASAGPGKGATFTVFLPA